jgi:amidophosphoribosyltransferase
MCGFVSIISESPVAADLLLGLQSIQHRGQDAAGLGVLDSGRPQLVKGLGMVTKVFDRPRTELQSGTVGIAHVRYPTTGTTSTREDAQPFLSRWPGVLLAHNGNVVNLDALNSSLRDEGAHVLSQCDAESILVVLSRELIRIRPSGHTTDDIVSAVKTLFKRVRGGYTVVAAMEVDGVETLVTFRDPHGVRPGVYGERHDGAWMVASESVALDVAGFKRVGDIPPGSMMVLRNNTQPVIHQISEKPTRHCIFERIYFARPDSMMEDGRVNRSRWRMGRQLAHEWAARELEADVVMAVPDTSRPAAMAIAEALNIPNREGFIKNRYSGRTFIMPTQAARKAALRLKLNPIPELFEGKRVLLVDDSIVRGNTMQRLVELVRSLGPKEIHLAIFSPPVAHPCFYGIDMPSHEELIASRLSPNELSDHFGADSLTYLSIEGLRDVAGDKICDACFSGDYMIEIDSADREAINAARRPNG